MIIIFNNNTNINNSNNTANLAPTPSTATVQPTPPNITTTTTTATNSTNSTNTTNITNNTANTTKDVVCNQMALWCLHLLYHESAGELALPLNSKKGVLKGVTIIVVTNWSMTRSLLLLVSRSKVRVRFLSYEILLEDLNFYSLASD